MSEAFEFEDVLRLPSLTSSASDAWKVATGTPCRDLFRFPDFRVALLGPPDSGKTAFLQAFLDPSSHGVVNLGEGPGPDTLLPIEFLFGSDLRVWGHASASDGNGMWRSIRVKAKRIDVQQVSKELSNNFDRLRIAFPHPLLDRWNMRLLDLPSIGSGTKKQDKLIHDALNGDSWAGLYIVNPRGLSDFDLDAIQHLNLGQLAVIANIRDKELQPTRDTVKAGLLDGTVGAALDYTIPLIVHDVREHGTPERRIIGQVLALLRWLAIVDALPKAAEAVRSSQQSLISHARRQLLEVSAISDSDALLPRLDAAARLLALHKWLANDGRQAATAIDLLENTCVLLGHREPRDLMVLLRKRVDALIALYNIRSGERARAESKNAEEPSIGFGDQFVKARTALRRFVGNILEEETPLNLMDSETRALKELDQHVADGRIELALLGMFSSGKSSVINALLGIDVDDKNPSFLPTGVTPETSTVNYLHYAPVAKCLGIDWMDEVELRFLSEPRFQSSTLRVHAKEIEAFDAWISRGEVRWADCDLDVADLSGASGRIRQAARKALIGGQSTHHAFKTLLKSVRNRDGGFAQWAHPPTAPDFAINGQVKLPRSPIAIGVRVKRFTKEPRISIQQPLVKVFERVRDPSIALRIGRLRVGYPHELLRHAAIIDTPGTDSPVPHHRKMARDIIGYRRCPVLYCFLGTQPVGWEDEENIAFLRESKISRGRQERLFFVLTCKRQVSERNHPELRRYVGERLRRMQIKNRSVYFVEAAARQDSEFLQLKGDIQEFVVKQQAPEYASWIERLEKILRSAERRAKNSLRDLDESEEEREQRRAELCKTHDRLTKLQKELGESSSHGIPWAWNQVLRRMNQLGGEIDDTLASLSSKDDFDEIAKIVDQQIDELNEEVARSMKSALPALAGKLRSSFAEVAPGRTIDLELGVMSWEPFFSGAEVAEAATGVEWKSWWFFRFSETKQENIRKNRSTLESAWARAWNSGTSKAEKAFDRIAGTVSTQMDLAVDEVKHDLEEAQRPQDDDAREHFTETVKVANRWLSRLAALKKQHRKAL